MSEIGAPGALALEETTLQPPPPMPTDAARPQSWLDRFINGSVEEVEKVFAPLFQKREEELRCAQDALVNERTICTSYVHLKDNFRNARTTISDLRPQFQELCGRSKGDIIKYVVDNVALHQRGGGRPISHFLQVLIQAAMFDWLQSHWQDIYTGIEREVVGYAEKRLREFENRHHAILKKYGLLEKIA